MGRPAMPGIRNCLTLHCSGLALLNDLDSMPGTYRISHHLLFSK